MATINSSAMPFFERKPRKNILQRFGDLTILFLLLALLLHRIYTLHTYPGALPTTHLLALLCESWFLFYWAIIINCKWKPYETKTYLDRLEASGVALPAVDVFVTTADPDLEPPVVTANTVLSILAVEYPVDKIACYVSDDAGSPLTYWTLVEAAKFARRWVPFCRKYNVRVRAPAVYFADEKISRRELPGGSSDEFMSEWMALKKEYTEFLQRVEDTAKSNILLSSIEGIEEFANFQRRDHPPCVKVICNNKDKDGHVTPTGIPHLIYVAREKRPKYHHHYKAGAMNALTRVSGVMTNAPFILNLDCDMFVNNTDVIKHAMCLILGFTDEVSCGFVQFPQKFYGGLKDDPYGNQLDVLNYTMSAGFDGIQGVPYGGTCCFHRRKVIYGASPGDVSTSNRNLRQDELERKFGKLKEVVESTKQTILEETNNLGDFRSLENHLEVARETTKCTYEFNTCWGQEIGWPYDTITEDVALGIRIQSTGWRSIQLIVDPHGFLGSAPTSGLATLTQYKRWCMGLFEVLITSKISPIKGSLTKKLMLRQCLAYLYIHLWAFRSIPETLYSLIPAYCLLTRSSFLPKIYDASIIIPLSIFMSYNLFSLLEYLQCNLTIMTWWNNQRMRLIISSTSWLFGFASVILRMLGLSDSIFDITPKNQADERKDNGNDPCKFTFDASPLYIPAVALLLVSIVAFVVGLFDMLMMVDGNRMSRVAEMICCAWVVLSFWPFVKGLYRRGRYGIPWSIVWKSTIIASLFLQLCLWSPPN